MLLSPVVSNRFCARFCVSLLTVMLDPLPIAVWARCIVSFVLWYASYFHFYEWLVGAVHVLTEEVLVSYASLWDGYADVGSLVPTRRLSRLSYLCVCVCVWLCKWVCVPSYYSYSFIFPMCVGH